jgi:diguanylate cyclase (GGDEF)-like protein
VEEAGMTEGTSDDSGRAPVAAPRARRRTVSVRLLVLLVALLPVLGMLAIAVSSSTRRNAERLAAAELDDDAAELVAIIDARAAAAGEEVSASVLAIGADLGVDGEELGERYDRDFLGELADARATVDADPILSTLPEVADQLAAVRGLRNGVDRGQVSFAELHVASRALTTALDEVWQERFRRRATHPDNDALPATINVRLSGLYAAFLALSSGADRAALTSFVLIGDPTEDDLVRLAEATGAFDAAMDMFPARIGPAATAAWRAHLERPAAQRFEAVLDDALAATLTGAESPLSGDVSRFGDAYIDGPDWAAGLTETVLGAAEDLRSLADAHAAGAARALWIRVAGAVAIAALSLAMAALAAQQVVPPIKRLEAAAHQVHEGRFDLEPMEVAGPRELADTAAAFNEMTSTLAAVEGHAVALADDPGAPLVGDRLPGRTGRALHVALNRLRSSMQAAEEHRRALEQAATHDGLTGLVNRSAALEVITRNLSLASREGGTVMALFIDLDGLKAINDRFGHATGDEALRRAAVALRSATRTADVVARFGGDEFVVSGIAHDVPAEVEAVAERVRAAVAAASIATPDGSLPLRCSIGMATARPGASAAALIDDADTAMYLAKRRGRDQAAWFDDVPRAMADAGAPPPPEVHHVLDVSVDPVER